MAYASLPQGPTAPGNQQGAPVQLGANSTPGTPSTAQGNAFLPSAFRDPYLQGINTGTQVQNYSSQSLPQASQFEQSLFSPNITPMAQSYLNSAATLSNNTLANTQASLEGQFENSAGNGALAPAMLQAANNSSAQIDQLAGQLGQQQQSLAAGALPTAYGAPIQGNQAAQSSSQGLYNMGQQAMYGDSSYPLSIFGSQPFASPSIISQPGTASKGK